MEDDKANSFVTSLVKSIQALCNGCIEFSSSVEVVGHIHLRIDRSVKMDYVLAEEVSKSSASGEDTTLFASNSYHSKPPCNITASSFAELSKRNRRKCHQVPRVDDSECMDFTSNSSVGASVPSAKPDACSIGSSQLSEGSCSSQADKSSASHKVSTVNPVLIMKRKLDEAIVIRPQNSADIGRQSTSASDFEPSATKPESDNSCLPTETLSHPEDIKIKEEPKDEPLDSCATTSSDMATGQGTWSPDFNNAVMESLSHVSQVEGTQLGGSDAGIQGQLQPYPIMLHSYSRASAAAVPGPSTGTQTPVSGSSDWKARRSEMKTRAKLKQTAKTKLKISSPGSSQRRTSSIKILAKNTKRSRSMPSLSMEPKVVLPKLDIDVDRYVSQKCKSDYLVYTKNDMEKAIEMIHRGTPVIDAALKCGIPRATLFNRSRDGCETHGGRCSEVFFQLHGREEMYKRRMKTMQYTQETMEQAIEAIHNGMPVIDASILYNIPRASLFTRSSRGCPSHPGRCSTVFSNGKLRRTKVSRFQYLQLMEKSGRILSHIDPSPFDVPLSSIAKVELLPLNKPQAGSSFTAVEPSAVESTSSSMPEGVEADDPLQTFQTLQAETQTSEAIFETLSGKLLVKVETPDNGFDFQPK